MQGFVKEIVGVSGRVLSASSNTSCQKSRVVEYLFGQRMLKSFQARIGGMWVLMGCATIWNTKWLKDHGGIPSNTVVEDLELSWRAQQDHKVNYIHNALCFTEDPTSLSKYISQIYRWYSWRPVFGFVDFMKLRRGLKAVIAWSIIDTFMAVVVTVFLAYSLLIGRIDYVGTAVFIDWIILASLTGYEGFKVGKFWDAIESLPYYMALRYFNIVILVVAWINPKKKVVLKIKERAYQIIIALLVLACLGVGMSDPHVVSEKNKMTQKIVLIRDDDVKDDTAALEWMTNTIIAKDAKCTYATIPHLLTQSGITYLKSLDPARFELATHGYDHTETENQVAVMATAKDLMIADFGRVPTSIAPPYEIVPPGFADEAKKLGYHSQINGNIGSSTGLYTFPFNFRWESGWNQYNASYHSLDDFKKSFDGWYNNSSRRVFHDKRSSCRSLRKRRGYEELQLIT